jgi:DNA-binding IclR family transcriptional regulator
MSKTFVSVEKVLDILLAFDVENAEISAQEISERLSLPLSSVYKYLEVLLKKGFLAKAPDSKRYILGLSVFSMLNVCIVGKNLTEIAFPRMNQLRELTDETVFLTVLNGWEGMCIEKAESRRMIKIGMSRGGRKPLYAGADGKVVLAYQDSNFVDSFFEEVPMEQYTKFTVTDPVQLRAQFEEIRCQGFCYTDSELDEGAVALAAPIFDHKKKLVGSLAVAGPKERMTEQHVAEWQPVIMQMALDISRDLGFRGRKLQL